MTFAKHMTREAIYFVIVLLLAALTLPLWLPFWLWITVANWWDLQRFYWECDQRYKRDAEEMAKRNAGVKGGSDAT